MNILQKLLKEHIDKDHLSMRAAAKQIGVAHTTLIRIVNGEACDMPTLQKLADWLEVSPSSLLDTIESDDITKVVASIISADPILAEAFILAGQHVIDGEMTPEELREIAIYAAWRFSVKKNANKL